MEPNEIQIDRAQTPVRLSYAENFNVAVPFIDRHPREGRGEKIAIHARAGDVTYAELAANVNRAASGFTALGLRPGDRLLMIIKDCPAFFYTFWGAIKAGVIPVPLNTLLRSDTYAFVIENSAATAFFYSPEFSAEVERALELSAHKPSHVLPTEGANSLDAVLAQASDTFEAVPSTPDSDCFWLYSSGSTGRPKGAVHRQRDMVATSVLYGVEVLGIREDDICYSEAKLFFAYGIGNALTFPLWVGATSVLNESKPGPDTSFPLIARHRPTLYYGVPTLYAAYLALFDKQKPDLSSIRACVSAGEALPPDIYQRWKAATGLDILDGIGSTEALHIFISNRHGAARPGSSGLPVPGYGARIVDDAGDDILGAGEGRLFISGPSLARCYWNNPEKTAATMVGDWFDTGDTYRRDDEGFYYYCGRTDDMMKVGGIWCSAFDIESKLIEHPAVLEAAVVGKADAESLIKPAAYVVLQAGREGDAALTAELMQFCKSRLAPYQYPRWIRFVPELPKTATGKIQRFRLRAEA
ncbi:benzoate--CoA ligase [Rhodoblastus sphagnicola]|uniref:Benzoate--CoA ligase n=1 Tax=Rhodoblastus sphagnicola TaxID=333368 RepID=A0A2S6MX45_9HYPH|nr:benzoate-CoA ligase family protein [Rhodoblastus sphagnicola]MBB4199262.1 benzoate-CoA ligase family protein [Rhodoblastus sphagnicola]PPQ26931.1 benzoate--CoA ligase [Rhodoblastus sphagnicola]